MKLEDRISNIKKLLDYCPVSSNEVMLYDEECADFFSEFFSSQPDRFKKPEYDKCHVRIGLHGMLDKDYITNHYTISLEYCYYYDRSDGEDWTFYYFKDPECYYRDFERPTMEYSEIPDNIWERIQDILYAKAADTIINELKEARESVKYWEGRKEEFDTRLKLSK